MSKEKAKVLGCDPGTAFFQSAQLKENNQIEYKTIRNAFIELDATEQTQQALAQNNWQYVHDKQDKKYYILGDDAMKMARMFPNLQVRRPMADGVLNKNEDKKMIVLSSILEQMIGKSQNKFDTITTCVSSPPVDGSQDSAFHKSRLQGMFKQLGYDVNVIEQGHAVILAQNPKMKQDNGTESSYSGLGISFGGGRVNLVLAYKNKPIIGLSASRSGDWVDKMSAQATGVPVAQVISYKQKNLDFENIDNESDIAFALNAYYEKMLQFVFANFAKKFKQIKSQFPGTVQIVIAGGTSMPKGFVSKVKSVLKDMDLPFQVRQVRHATDPRNTVAKGLLLHGIVSQKRKIKQAQQNAKKQVEIKQEKKKGPDKVNLNDLPDDGKF